MPSKMDENGQRMSNDRTKGKARYVHNAHCTPFKARKHQTTKSMMMTMETYERNKTKKKSTEELTKSYCR